MRLGRNERITVEIAERRALASLGTKYPKVASAVADDIWPGHPMKAQGAGAAAAGILARLTRKGKVYWTIRNGTWGYVKH